MLRFKVLKEFKTKTGIKYKGEVIELEPEKAEKLIRQGFIEPVDELQKQPELTFPIYINEFISKKGLILKDVLILNKEQLETNLRDKYYGDAFQEFIKQYKTLYSHIERGLLNVENALFTDTL